MLEKLTPEQFLGWMAKDSIEPIGWRRFDFGIARLQASLTGTKESPVDPIDLMPFEVDHTEESSPESEIRQVRNLARRQRV